jgi:hypothetical protein
VREIAGLCRKRAAVLGESFEGRRESCAVLVVPREDVVSFREDLASLLEVVVSHGEVVRESSGDRRERHADRR